SISLCRYHHGLVHEGQWKLTHDHDNGAVHVTRPDGRPYEIVPSRPYVSPTQQATSGHPGGSARRTPNRPAPPSPGSATAAEDAAAQPHSAATRAQPRTCDSPNAPTPDPPPPWNPVAHGHVGEGPPASRSGQQ